MRIDEPETPGAPGRDDEQPPPAAVGAGADVPEVPGDDGSLGTAATLPGEPPPPAPPPAGEDIGGAAVDGEATPAPAGPSASASGSPLLTHVLGALTWASRTVEELANRAGAVMPLWLVWPGLICVCAAAGAWMLSHHGQLAEINTNKLAEAERAAAMRWVWKAALAYFGAFVIGTVVDRVRSGAWRPVRVAATLPRWLSFLIGLPLVALLGLPQIESVSAKLSIFLAACAALACLPTFLVAAEALQGWSRGARAGREETESSDDVLDDARPSLSERVAQWSAPVAIAGLWAWYGWFFSRLSITNHHALNTRTTDLGYYDNIFYQSIHGNFLGCSFIRTGNHASAHFDPLLVLLSPIYLLSQRAETILTLQAFWLGAAVVPIYLMAVDKLRSRVAGVALAFCYVLYPAVHGANMYEFHSLTLITPMLIWLLYFLERGSRVGYWLTFVLLLLLREDVPLVLCFVGLYSILRRRPGGAWQGLITIALSLVYFVVVKKAFMPSEELLNTGSAESYGFGYYYDAMIPAKDGATGLVTSLLTNPAFVLKHALDEPKLQFLLLLFLPLGFLPFFARPARVMLVYGLIFCLLASRTAVFTIHFQYASLLFAVAFAITPIALARLSDSTVPPSWFGVSGRRMMFGLLGSMMVVTSLLSWKFGGVAENSSFRGGFVRVARKLSPEQRETYAWVQAQTKSIPRRASVAASPKLGPHISNRKAAYFHTDRGKKAEYLFVDEGEMKGTDLERHQKEVEARYNEVARRGKMALFKRK
jgi:uncharacterized membrane protein